MSAPTTSGAPFILRPGADADRNYIIKTWLTSHRQLHWWRPFADASAPPDKFNRPQWLGIDPQCWWAGHGALVEALLPHSAILIAAFEEDPDTIMGYAVTSTGAVHYVYVRNEFRRHGIARALLRPFLSRKDIVYTHPPTLKAQKIPEGWTYDPYRAIHLAINSAPVTRGADPNHHIGPDR